MKMEGRKRNTYVALRQKKKLIELVTKNPQLISFRVSQGFSYKDSQTMWQDIAKQCNAIPGARKTWRQWKKTWQDLRSKMKKRQQDSDKPPPNLTSILTPDEKEALGLTNSNTSSETYDKSYEMVMLDENEDNNLDNENDSADCLNDTDPPSPVETKVFVEEPRVDRKLSKLKSKHNSSKHLNCYFNCDTIAAQEQRKIQIKEDYLNFKKDYLRQKLKLLKEQTEALKTIACELKGLP